MTERLTLRQIVTAHPEWMDLDLGVLRSDGYLDRVLTVELFEGTTDREIRQDNPDGHQDTVVIIPED